MATRKSQGKELQELIEAAIRGELTETQAAEGYKFGPEAVTLLLLATTRRIAELEAKTAQASKPDPSTRTAIHETQPQAETQKAGSA